VDIVVNGQTRTVAAKTTVARLLVELQLAGRPVAVEMNQTLVPRAEHAACVLAPGDRIEIVTLVGGG
jgi:thiamine biosynthesis protein ThiS